MNLFFITSPFQYLCAVEAREYFKTTKNTLVVVRQDTEIGKKQERELIDESQWDEVIYLPRKNRTLHIPRIIKRFKNIKFDNFFFSELNSWRTSILLANIQAKKRTHIDDGTMTLLDYNREKTPPRGGVKQLLLLSTGIKVNFDEISKPIDFFTIFNLKKTKNRNQITNKLTTLKSQGRILYNEKSPIIFIGQGCIGEKGHMPIRDYTSMISSIYKENGADILYYPHRTESEHVKNEISSLSFIKYQETDLPIEIELLRSHAEVSGIIGGLSTALFTIKTIEKKIPTFYTRFQMPTLDSTNMIKHILKKHEIIELKTE